jgi:oligopeptide/dipeptide ABC transporter ATP-binding protein
VEHKQQRIVLSGDVPSPANPPSGCRFHTRCPFNIDQCRKEEPPLEEVESGHKVACHRYREVEKLIAERFGKMALRGRI